MEPVPVYGCDVFAGADGDVRDGGRAGVVTGEVLVVDAEDGVY